MYNCAPPKLLFTNAGNRSPQDFIHDQYGVPATVEIPTISNENLMQSNDVRWWNYSGSTPSERLARIEKHFLYGTIVEECMHWMNMIQERHSFQLTTTGFLESWYKPDGSFMNPQEDGSQLDGYSLHNPDFWFVYLKNLYTTRRLGPLLDIEKEYILKRILAAEFPRKLGDLENEYHQSFWSSRASDYFASGKINEVMLENWLFPFELTKEIRISADNYVIESFHEDYDPESPGSEFTDLQLLQFDFLTGSGILNQGISCYHTRNVTGGEPTSYYQYAISLVRLPYRIDRQIVNDPDIINDFLGPYTEAPRKMTLRNACGFYGASGRNAAIAFNVKTRDASVYGDDTLIDVPLDGFRVGIIWLDSENNNIGFPNPNDPNANPSFNLLELNSNTTWLNEDDLEVGVNIIEFPDEVLDYVPDQYACPFLVFSPPNQPVAEEDRVYQLTIDADISNLDVPETAYLHNYPMLVGGAGVFRYCTDDYLMSADEIIQ